MSAGPLLALLLLGAPGAATSSAASARVLSVLADAQEGALVVTADRFHAEPGAELFSAEGEVVLERGPLLVRADRMRFDRARGRVLAEGSVLVIDPRGVVRCERVELAVPGLDGVLLDAVVELEAKALGAGGVLRSRLVAHAERLERRADKTYAIEGGQITACDCGEGSAPLWRIDARHAEVDPREGAWLEWPVFYAKGLPVFVLPFFYVPLGERRTGLLVPRLGGLGNALTGPHVFAPFFWAADERFDLTLEPGLYTLRGPALALELRHATRADRAGKLRLFGLLDYGEAGADGFSLARAAPLFRGSLAYQGAHRLQEARVVSDVNVVSDAGYWAELGDEFLSRQVESTLSRVTLSWGSDRTRTALALQLEEELRPDRLRVYSVASGRFEQPEARGVALLSGALSEGNGATLGPGLVRQRLFSLRMDAFPAPLGPALGEARLLLDGFLAPRPELPRFFRADLRPELSLPLSLGTVATFEPSAALRLTGWAGHAAGADAGEGRVAPVLRARLVSELGRGFGPVVHRVRPELGLVLIPHVAGPQAPRFANGDEVDLLGEAFQVAARLRSELLAKGSGQRLLGLELFYGRDLGLSPGEGVGGSELLARADAEVTPLSWLTLRLAARGAWEIEARRPAELSLGLSLSAGEVLSVSLAGLEVRARPPRTGHLASEELVPSTLLGGERYVPLGEYQARVALGEVDLAPWTAFRGAALGVALRPARGWLFGFDMVLSFEDAADRSVVRNTRALFSWTACDCMELGLTVSTDRSLPPGWFGLPGLTIAPVIELSRLGETRE